MTNHEGISIAKDVFGEKYSDDELWSIMWERTGWPSFFDGDPKMTLRQQLETFKEVVG